MDTVLIKEPLCCALEGDWRLKAKICKVGKCKRLST